MFSGIIALAGDDLYLDISQIIPTREVEEYMISMADKNQEESLSSKSQTNKKNYNDNFGLNALMQLTQQIVLYLKIGQAVKSHGLEHLLKLKEQILILSF